AFELGRQLLRQGVAVPFVGLFASPFPSYFRLATRMREQTASSFERLNGHLRELIARSWTQRRLYLADKIRVREARRQATLVRTALGRPRLGRAPLAAVRRFAPGVLAGRLVLFLPNRQWSRACGALDWRTLSQSIDVHFGPDGCNADNIL